MRFAILVVAALFAGCTEAGRFVQEHEKDVESARVKLDGADVELRAEHAEWDGLVEASLEALAEVENVHRASYDEDNLRRLREGGEFVELRFTDGIRAWPDYPPAMDTPVRQILIFLAYPPNGPNGHVLTCRDDRCGEWTTTADLNALREAALRVTRSAN